jgi:hypothetical protein
LAMTKTTTLALEKQLHDPQQQVTDQAAEIADLRQAQQLGT